ncbi:MAG: damage-inducible protein DinB [Ignavibacteria bacterium]|nr:damage-inducible protein DinB [Ignavibacteria bacterium]MBT8392157.1 damage-inducible protein DinB [Ignavibacteria bacterium]NNJ53557.1 damage-inducible protein DinB [Ignavibacteriaceae bacterium]NNL21429.1 damage-inducible protein DinB [Ignavibacteriaceae bacterium]
MHNQNINLLFQHMEWADAKVWDSVLEQPSANNDSKMKKLLYHISSVQRAFFYVRTKQPLVFPKETDFLELLDIAKWGYECYTQNNEYLNSLNENELKNIIEIPWAKRLENIIGQKPEEASLEETMLQVTTHSAYHRGQVNARLRETGGEPPMVDFIAWVWLGKPKAAWGKVNS